MDPDIVRQQEEAEREALAALAKKASGAHTAGQGTADGVPPQAPVFFNSSVPHQTFPEGFQVGPASGARAPVGKPGFPPRPEAGMDDSAFARLGRFMSFGLAGGMLGGGAGIMAANYWQLSTEQANLAIFGPAGALAMFCATASLFVGRPQPPRSGER